MSARAAPVANGAECGDRRTGRTGEEILAQKVVAAPWLGPHHVYGVFMVPERYEDRRFVPTLTVTRADGTSYHARIRHDRRDDAVAEPGCYARRVYVPTRVAVRFLVTGRFRDLTTASNWSLTFPGSDVAFSGHLPERDRLRTLRPGTLP